MIETAEELVGKLTTLAIGGAVLVAIGMILWAWVVKRTVSAVIGVIILAAVVLFAINATDWLQEKVSEDVGASLAPIEETFLPGPAAADLPDLLG